MNITLSNKIRSNMETKRKVIKYPNLRKNLKRVGNLLLWCACVPLVMFVAVKLVKVITLFIVWAWTV